MRPDFAATAPMRRQRFLRHPEQVAAARQFVTEPLVRGSEVRETARLLVSEIVTSLLDRMPSILGAGSFEVAYAMVDGWIRVEVSDDGGPARLAPLGQLALRLGVVVPQQARPPEPVPGLPARAPPTRAEPGPFLRLLAAGIGLLALGAAVGALAGRKHARGHTGTTSP